MNPLDLGAERFEPIRQARERIAKAEAAHAASRDRARLLRDQTSDAERRDRKRLGEAHRRDRRAGVGGREDQRGARAGGAAGGGVKAALEEAGQLDALVAEYGRKWRREAMPRLMRAERDYRSAIDQLEQKRNAFSREASLYAWLGGAAGVDAVNDAVGGSRVRRPAGQPALSFNRVLTELRQDADAVADWPMDHDAPAAVQRLEITDRAAAGSVHRDVAIPDR